MATILREACLDENDKPTRISELIQEALLNHKCSWVCKKDNSRFRKGDVCGAELHFWPIAGVIGCRRHKFVAFECTLLYRGTFHTVTCIFFILKTIFLQKTKERGLFQEFCLVFSVLFWAFTSIAYFVRLLVL